MIRNGRNDVDELSYEAVTLERSWSPFLRCLKFTGVAYDWFAKVEGCHSSAARHIISFAVSVLAVVNNAYFFIQLAIVKWEELETTKLVSMLSICAIHIPPILTAFTFSSSSSSSDLGSVRPVEDARVGFEMFQRFEDQISNENPIQRSFLQCFLRCRLFIDLECDGTRFPVFLQPLLRFVRHFRIVPSRPGSERERLFQSPVAHVHD